MALLSEADLINSLDDALMIISSGAHHHHHRHAGRSTSSTAKSLTAAAADHGPPPLPGSSQPPFHAGTMGAGLSSASDEWSRPHRSSSVSSTSSGSLSDGSTTVSTPDSDVSTSEPISRASTVSLSITTTPAAVHAYANGAITAQLDPLARNYPAPAATDRLDLDEMLARKPQKWTLGHYFHKSRAAGYNDGGGSASDPSNLSSPPLDGIAAGHRRKSELERAKKELLAAQEEIQRLAVGRL
ncbi:hypothetical protein RB595_000636 [Gaeumannomyces hyphopodioides]